jgi:single-strand DNA-binding protein
MAFNKVILIGNLTADPELKQTTSGLSVCSFNIAVNRPKSKDGEQACDFISIQAWRQTAEFVCKFFKKGKPILVCGRLQTRSYTDNQGNKRTATEVVADEVTFVGNNESSTESKPQPYVPSAYQTSQPQFEEVTDDGDLPF